MSHKTTMGGPNESFEQTHWSEILDARTTDDARRRAAVEYIARRYWKPVYCYLLRKGYDGERCKDLTQGFFTDVVLKRQLIQKADPAKGKFRSLLLTALDRYVVSVHRSETAGKRADARPLLSIGDAEDLPIADSRASATSEDAYNYAWACKLVNDVLAELQEEYMATHRSAHWAVFRERVVRPTLEGANPRPLQEICSECGIEDSQKASNIILNAKRRFRTLLRAYVSRTVSSEEEIDAEIADLITAVSKPKARWGQGLRIDTWRQ